MSGKVMAHGTDSELESLLSSSTTNTSIRLMQAVGPCPSQQNFPRNPLNSGMHLQHHTMRPTILLRVIQLKPIILKIPLLISRQQQELRNLTFWARKPLGKCRAYATRLGQQIRRHIICDIGPAVPGIGVLVDGGLQARNVQCIRRHAGKGVRSVLLRRRVDKEV